MGLSEAQKKERADYLENNLNITECSQKNPYAFISYASDNWETVFKKAVVPLQKQYGLRVYADRAFDKVNVKWIVPMLRNIRGADLVIVFVSQSYIESYACFLELLTAVNNKKRIVFVALDQELRLGDTTDLPGIERGIKSEILNQGANIVTNTNNSSNDIMRAMKSAFTSISTLLEQDALSKYDISDAFINFFREASINKKTINDLGALRGTIKSVSSDIFDKAAQKGAKQPEVETVVQMAAEQQFEVQSVADFRFDEPEPRKPAKTKFDLHNKKFLALFIGGTCALAAIIVVVLIATMPKYVEAMSYEFGMLDGNIRRMYAGTYTGGWKNGMPYRQGTFVYEEDKEDNQKGFIYEGKWKKGLANGQGTMTYASGDIYKGEWADGNKNGQGTYTYASGSVYEGEWADGNRNGQGTYTYASGSVYEGEWVDGNKNGQGTYTYASGDIYKGEWVDGNRNGQGTMTYASGDIYKGEWADDNKNGQGTYTWTSGAVYEGEWVEGDRNGQGTMTYASGAVYEGEWADDKRNGQGTMTYNNENKDVYVGNWVSGVRSGKGTLTSNDGYTYEGEWADNKHNGHGVETYNNGDEYDGNFAGGKRSGQGTYTWANGTVYEGEWADDDRNGQGTQTSVDGVVYKGEWKDGKFVE